MVNFIVWGLWNKICFDPSRNLILTKPSEGFQQTFYSPITLYVPVYKHNVPSLSLKTLTSIFKVKKNVHEEESEWGTSQNPTSEIRNFNTTSA